MKKKVLFLITKSNWGGAQRYVYDLATTLDHSRYEPVVALGGAGELKEKLETAGIRTVTLQSLQRNISVTKELCFAWELWKLLRQEKSEVLHVNSSKAGGVGCFVGRLTLVPRIIFTAHGWAFNEDRTWVQKKIFKFFHWLTIILSDQTIAVSNGLAAQMNWPLVKRKMLVINPGRTVPTFLDKESARQEIAGRLPHLPADPNEPWLMTIAELHPIKRHAVLFVAMKNLITQFPTLRLICIGDGQLREELTKEITNHNLQNNVFLTGSIHEAADYLQAATIFILPSQSESYGYVLHEAALANVPCVATNVGGVSDIIDDNVTGTLVTPNNPSALAAAVTTYLKQESLAITHTVAAHKKLSPRTVSRMTRQTEAVYETSRSS